MSDLPLHPALVHLPIGLSFFMPLLTISLIILFKKDIVKRIVGDGNDSAKQYLKILK